MTPAQLSALKADIQANYAADLANGRYNFIAEAYNVLATPDFYVWRTSMSSAELKNNIVWTELVAATQGKRDVCTILLNEGSVNPSDDNVRAAFVEIFGAGGTSTSQLAAAAKRKANKVEKMFAVGTGTEGDPAKLVFEGTVSGADVIFAMGT